MRPRGAYIARISRVLEYIEAHLAEPLGLATLASVANFSPWHFHRVFQSMTGETLAEHVRRRRLEVAAGRLLASPLEPVFAVALDVGFGSAAVFSRAFSAHFGATPTAWRRGAFGLWTSRRQVDFSKIRHGERKPRQAAARTARDDVPSGLSGQAPRSGGEEMKVTVEIKTLPDVRVAYMRHVGPYGDAGIEQTWQRFATWCSQNGLMDKGRAMYGISRYDACIEVDANFQPQGEIGVQVLRGGSFACAQFASAPTEIHEAWLTLCKWLPESGFQAADAAPIELYRKDAGADDGKGAFTCTLCMPVKPA